MPVQATINSGDAPATFADPTDRARALRHYWTRGEGAAKIRWGTDGDLTRCHRYLQRFVGPYAWGTCQNYHKALFGRPNPRD